MTDDLSAFEFTPTLCAYCTDQAAVRFLWDKPCGHPSAVQVCSAHVRPFLEQAGQSGRWLCHCGQWADYRLQDCLQVVRVAHD